MLFVMFSSWNFWQGFYFKKGYTLQWHDTENSKQKFPEKELRGYSPNFYIHVSVNDLYIPLIGLPILMQENRWTKRGNIHKSLTDT